MRIGISCYPTHGGSGVVATELGKHLAERGHDLAVSQDGEEFFRLDQRFCIRAFLEIGSP